MSGSNVTVGALFRWIVFSIVTMNALGFSGGCSSRVDDEVLITGNNRGVALMGRFEYDAAWEVFSQLAENHPANADVLTNLAIATLNRQQTGDDELALEILGRALESDPGHLRALYCRSLIFLYQGAAEPALAGFLQVFSGDPSDADAAYHAGQGLMQLERVGEAIEWYERAIELDPYLRSAYYRGFQAMQREGRRDEGRAMLETFQSLADNPRSRLVEFKYTKMGRRGAAATFDGRLEKGVEPPGGPLFVDPVPVLSSDLEWRSGDVPTSITVADIDGDNLVDLFLPASLDRDGASVNAVFLRRTDGFEISFDHPLANVENVVTALWGDLDDDGLTDVYLCRLGSNQLWLNTGDGWEERTESTGTSGGEYDTVDGALVDADHDGDLDIFLVNSNGPNELLNNNRDGSFRPLAEERGLAGEYPGSRQVLFADLDGDRDLDIVVRNASPPHEVFENKLLWDYEPASGFDDLCGSDMASIIAGDADADGRTELYTADSHGALHRWRTDGSGSWEAEMLAEDFDQSIDRLALADVSGDGAMSLMASSSDEWRVMNIDDGSVVTSIGDFGPVWALAALDPGQGPSLIEWSSGMSPRVHRPGPGRYPFVVLALTGRENETDAMRSNTSGIGTRVAMRAGSRWTVADTLRNSSGPGQSLQPLELGAGGRERVDFVALDWPDGVFQTEMDLEPGVPHVISETQRQLSSCPVLFAWNGSGYDFVSDILGVGGIGYAVGPGEYGEPRPWENYLLPEGVPAERDGRLTVKVAEPMEEALYLDAARLVAYDLPPGWSMALDERMGIAGPDVTGEPVFFRSQILPIRATNERGEVVTETILTADLQAAPVGHLDHRFIGLLAGEHILTLHFDQPLDEIGPHAVLVAEGWVEYPYSQTNFAAWQAGRTYDAPTLEARGSDGQWRVVLQNFGYPAGMPRRMSVALPPLPGGTLELRLRTNQEVYWDRLAVVVAEPNPAIKKQQLKLETARVERKGFAERSTGEQRLPSYDYARLLPLWDTRIQAGWYSRIGEVTDLVAAADDALAIIGPGEEIHLEFDIPSRAVHEGWRRFVVLETDGWCKDMDFYTRDGRTLEPLPARGDGDASLRARLHETYNTRYLDGRE